MPKRDETYMQQRRLEILAAAKRAAEKHGLAHITLRQIAAEAGMSLGTLSAHFKRREDLVTFAAEQTGTGVAPAKLAQALSTPTLLRELALDLELVAEARCHPELRTIVQRANKKKVSELGRHLSSGEKPTPRSDDTARLLNALAYGLAATSILGLTPRRDTIKETVEQLMKTTAQS